MVRNTMIAVFGSSEAADDAREAMIQAGFDERDVTVSIDLTSDGIAAEAPGQAFENQTRHNSGIDAWVQSWFSSIVDDDTADAQRIADVQRGSAVLTVAGGTAQLGRAAHLLQDFHPVALRRTS